MCITGSVQSIWPPCVSADYTSLVTLALSPPARPNGGGFDGFSASPLDANLITTFQTRTLGSDKQKPERALAAPRLLQEKRKRKPEAENMASGFSRLENILNLIKI